MFNRKTEISNYKLDQSFYKIHKATAGASNFGLDHTDTLIADGFGLYSSSGVKPKIGRLKANFSELALE